MTVGFNGFVNGLSADGGTAVGWVSPASDDTFQIACYWHSPPPDNWAHVFGPTTITNPNPIVGDVAEAFAVSSDGSIIVGVVQLPAIREGSPFKWTSGGLVPFYTVTGDLTPGQARAISSDGSRIAGFVAAGVTLHQACYWNGATLVKTTLGYLPGHNNSEVVAISADGSVIVGWSQLGASDITNSQRAFRWTVGGGMVDLGLPTDVVGALTSLGAGVSGDGTLVVGDYGTADVGGAWQWSAGNGMLQIAMSSASAVSGDGLTILGQRPDFPYYMAYLKGGTVTVPTPVALDPAFPATIQVTDGNGISANGSIIAGDGRPGAGTGFVSYVFLVP